ncbi:hypothetical protein [Bacillus mycoides]|uniref:hypothetical protein n=1 Tax=Bacillus mycoides TaxID=1405 RepID=UPI00366DA6FB
MFQQNSDRMFIIDANLAIMREHLKKTNAYLTTLQDKILNDYHNERYSSSTNEIFEQSVTYKYRH